MFFVIIEQVLCKHFTDFETKQKVMSPRRQKNDGNSVPPFKKISNRRGQRLNYMNTIDLPQVYINANFLHERP